MWTDVLPITLGAFFLALMLTRVIRKLASSHGVMDVPNERSSHTVPTPRGGGIAIVVATTAALAAFALSGAIALDLFVALSGGGIAVATVGFLDDRYGLPVRIRLIVHFGAALWALAWLGGLPPLQVADRFVAFGPFSYVLGALGIVWVLNLFNFMDGIDGIAASEAAFIGCGGALLSLTGAIGGGILPVSVAFAAACCGFLVWNWPPAKIFMGDAGSGYIGFVIAVIAIAAARENPAALPAWLILSGIFVVDATITFARRLWRHEKVHLAHRSHAYQWLARRWKSHRRVTLLAVLANVLWLLPCAVVAVIRPADAVWAVLVALVPLAIAIAAAGAGRRETSTD